MLGAEGILENGKEKREEHGELKYCQINNFSSRSEIVVS
jgi:hypothetical protein